MLQIFLHLLNIDLSLVYQTMVVILITCIYLVNEKKLKVKVQIKHYVYYLVFFLN